MSVTFPQLDARPLPELENELLGLAGHLAAAQCRFLRVLAEFDERDGWAGPGLKSCAHWLSWRIGMSLRTAHEHVRVAHALRRPRRLTRRSPRAGCPTPRFARSPASVGATRNPRIRPPGATGHPTVSSTAGPPTPSRRTVPISPPRAATPILSRRCSTLR